jgi:hypothetical protein
MENQSIKILIKNYIDLENYKSKVLGRYLLIMMSIIMMFSLQKLTNNWIYQFKI